VPVLQDDAQAGKGDCRSYMQAMWETCQGELEEMSILRDESMTGDVQTRDG